jgi:transcriptional regulator with PAS, ATPase and Fis domain
MNNTSVAQSSLKHTWKLMVERGIINEKPLRPIILRSWQRSKTLDPLNVSKNTLSRRKVQVKQSLISGLIQSVKPIMENICRVSGNTFVCICNHEGFVIAGYSNVEGYPYIGFDCSEETVGTNAIGTALVENQQLYVNGFEHYATIFQPWACQAAPIHDPSGRIMAVLNVTNVDGILSEWLSHIISLGVNVIENQLLYKSEQYQVQYLRSKFTSLIDLLQEHMIVIDKEGTIIDANLKTSSLLEYYQRENLIGQNIKKIIPSSDHHRLKNSSIPREFRLKSKNNNILNCYLLKQDKVKNNHYEQNLLLFSTQSYRQDMEKQLHGLDSPSSSALGRFIGNSPGCLEVKNMINRAAHYHSNVLIEGESGTGKELIARIIHDLSRRQGNFVAINCGAIPQGLIESELFGYEEGSFTGAKRGGSMGKLELAEGGTIFLDEIGEMPLDMQVTLLRFLQDKTISRLGSNKSKILDIRIIAATNRNLSKEITKGSFRQDLYYRLNVLDIVIPPLRERKADILPLALHLLHSIGQRLKVETNGISEEAIACLERYDWPGNVRELGNVIERALVFNESGTIVPADLPLYIRNQYERQLIPAGSSLKEQEDAIIFQTLQECNGNISKAAKILGISRVTLYRKMKSAH